MILLVSAAMIAGLGSKDERVDNRYNTLLFPRIEIVQQIIRVCGC
jgi:hypothetical protein